ncbi:MAG: hypothetical protein ACRD3Q_08680 [Terriglobales bacterium]
MKSNEIARNAVLEGVDNQLKSGDPSETSATYKPAGKRNFMNI